MCLPSPHLLSKPVGHTRKSKATIIKIKTKEILLGLFFQGGQSRCENPSLSLDFQVKGSGRLGSLPSHQGVRPSCSPTLCLQGQLLLRLCSQAFPAFMGQGGWKGAATYSHMTPLPCPHTACRPRYCRHRCTGC